MSGIFKVNQLWRCRDPVEVAAVRDIADAGSECTAVPFQIDDTLFADPARAAHYKKGRRYHGGYSTASRTENSLDLMECIGEFKDLTPVPLPIALHQIWQCRNQQYIWIATDISEYESESGMIGWSAVGTTFNTNPRQSEGLADDHVDNWDDHDLALHSLMRAYGWSVTEPAFTVFDTRNGYYEMNRFANSPYDLHNLLWDPNGAP